MALNPTDAERVRAIPLFEQLSDRSLPKLLKSASIRHFPPRTSLFNERDRANSLYTLINGSVELFSEHHDRRSTIAVIRSIKSIVLTLMPVNPISARTLERSELLVVPIETIQDLIDGDPAFARTLVHELACGLGDTIDDLKNYRLRTASERLAEWIVRSEQEAGGSGQFVLPYAKRVLASHLGMAPENLSRTLASLAAFGVVVRGRHVLVGNRAALAEFAKLEAAPGKERANDELRYRSPHHQDIPVHNQPRRTLAATAAATSASIVPAASTDDWSPMMNKPHV